MCRRVCTWLLEPTRRRARPSWRLGGRGLRGREEEEGRERPVLICAPLPQGSPPATPGSITSTVERSPGILPTPSSWSEAARSAGKSLAWGWRTTHVPGSCKRPAGVGWGGVTAGDPVCEGVPQARDCSGRWSGHTPLALNLLYAAKEWVPFSCGELSAFGRHGTPSAWDARMLTMEADSLSSLVLGSAANQGLFWFFLQFPLVYCYSLNPIKEVLGLESAGQYA